MVLVLYCTIAVVIGLITYRVSVARTHRSLSENSTRMRDPLLNAVTARMAHAMEVSEIPVFIYEIEPVNGLAAPDGRIFITRGFFNRYRAGEVSADEMASVIAHELGHVALGHAKRRMIDFSGQNALRTALTIIISRFIPFVGVYIAAYVTSILAAGLSRADEYAADEYATALMIKAGLTAGPQKSLFTKLEALTRSHHGRPPAWMMSHPLAEQRIQAIEKNEAKWLGSAAT